MISTPQENLKISDELLKGIEASRNIISVNEAESIRLKQLVNSMEYTIVEKNKELVEISEKIEQLNAILVSVTANYDRINGEIVLSSNVLDNLIKDINVHKLAISESNLALSEREKEVTNKENIYIKKNEDLTLKVKDISDRETKILNKESKINELINQLK